MNKSLAIVAISVLMTPALWCQVERSYSDKTVTVGEDVFLPFCRGEITARSEGASVTVKKVSEYLLSSDSIKFPVGYKVSCYSQSDIMDITLSPYTLFDGEKSAIGGAAVSLFFNNVSGLFRQPLVSDIYIQPVVTSDFFGYPVYFNGSCEITVIKKNSLPLFIPVSREEYLKALITKEELRMKDNNEGITEDETLKEMEKAYQQLLKTDREAAEEFKVQMDEFAANLNQESSSTDLLTMLKNELSGLTPAERKSQAFYEPAAFERNGNISGLSESDSEFAEPLVRPNTKAFSSTNGDIHIIAIQWALTSQTEDQSAPRLFSCRQKYGYCFTDRMLITLFNDRKTWEKVFELVR